MGFSALFARKSRVYGFLQVIPCIRAFYLFLLRCLLFRCLLLRCLLLFGRLLFFLDRLLGTDKFRTGELNAAEMIEYYKQGLEEYKEKIKPYLLYQ